MTAYRLQQRCPYPVEVTIYEASPRLGGKIRSATFTDSTERYEAGAAELYDYSGVGPDPLRELVAELGLSTQPMSGDTVIVADQIVTDTNDVGAKLGPAALAALLSFDRRAKDYIDPLNYYESDWKEDNDDPLMRRSFRWLLNRIKDPLARRYVEVMVHSDLATEPHLTNAIYGLQNYLMNDPAYMRLYSIDGGLETLITELVKRIDARVLLNQPVCRVARKGADLCVTSRQRGVEVHEDFDFVVAALPNNWLPAVEWSGEKLAQAMHKHHAHYDYPAHYLRVTLLFEKPFWREILSGSYFMHDAFGGCCLYDESARNPDSRAGVLGWLLGGDAALNFSNHSDEALIQIVLNSLPSCLRAGRELFRAGRVHRWVGTVNGLPGGRPMREPDSRHVPEPDEHPDLFVVGDYLFDSTLNGVLDSADVVAEWLVEEMEDAPAATDILPLKNMA